MPDPSSVTSQQINTEVGSPVTTQLDISGNNTIRNLACKSSGEISYGHCRWGINFRGGDYGGDYIDGVGGHAYTQEYAATPNLTVRGSTENTGVAAAARANLEINSNGTMVLNVVAGGITQTVGTTWLTSGVAGDYTANLIRTGALGTITGSGTNTDLVLSTTRSWSVNSSRATAGTDTDFLYGILVIKNTVGGAELIRRPVGLETTALRN